MTKHIHIHLRPGVVPNASATKDTKVADSSEVSRVNQIISKLKSEVSQLRPLSQNFTTQEMDKVEDSARELQRLARQLEDAIEAV